MELTAILERLGLADAQALLALHGPAAAVPPTPVPLPLLDPDEIGRRRQFVGLPEHLDAPLRAVAARVAADPGLATLAAHLERLLFDCPDYPVAHVSRWPTMESVFGADWGLFHLLLALAAVPRLRSAHARRGIPEANTRDTCTHYLESTSLFRLTHAGRWGMAPTALTWLRHHTSGELCAVGRFEYMLQPFAGTLTAYRHRHQGSVVALAADGTAFDDAGLSPLSGTFAVPTLATWTARLQDDGRQVTGHPLAPDGRARRQPVTLALADWTPVLHPGDPVLEVHIPPGGGMTPERALDSMRQAVDFFPRHYSERPFAGFGCTSWILNPELAAFYSPESNMVRWQRELYLFPIPSNGRAGLFFLFGQDPVDPATAPRDTSIRRAVLARLEARLPLRAGGMFLLTADLAQYGTAVYRRHARLAGLWHEPDTPA